MVSKLFCDRCGEEQRLDSNGFPEEPFAKKERLTIFNNYGDYPNDNGFERERDLCCACLQQLRQIQKAIDLEIIHWFLKE